MGTGAVDPAFGIGPEVVPLKRDDPVAPGVPKVLAVPVPVVPGLNPNPGVGLAPKLNPVLGAVV